MKIFVSGATGYIGLRLTERLADEGHEVMALYRSESKKNLLNHKNVTPVKGDILQPDSLIQAMKGCEQAYHVAAFAGVWAADPYTVYKTTVIGSLNFIRAAKANGIRRIVITSTAGILGPTTDNSLSDENVSNPEAFFSDYESAKFVLEQAIQTWKQAEPEIVLVNPTRVYGPGLLSESNGVTKMIVQYVVGKWRLIPGNGKSIGNYVFVDDVVNGHILAMEKGIPGERYLLAGENVSYNEFFEKLRKISGIHKTLFHIPLGISMLMARFMLFMARTFGSKPMIVPGLVKKFGLNWIVSPDKAIKNLGYSVTPLEEGMEKTLEWSNKK